MINSDKEFEKRDLLAFPFYFLGLFMLDIAIQIGGIWTSRRMIEFFNPKDCNNEDY